MCNSSSFACQGKVAVRHTMTHVTSSGQTSGPKEGQCATCEPTVPQQEDAEVELTLDMWGSSASCKQNADW
jgi:hypothetical protein